MEFWIAVASAIVGALASYGLTEPRRRRERKEDERRHQEELAAARADTRAAEVRARDLDAVLQTRQQVAALLADAQASVAGEGAPKPGRYSADVYPRANLALVADPDALAAFIEVLADLMSRAPGSGVRLADLQAVGVAENQAGRALAAQESRVLAGEPLRVLKGDELAALAPRLNDVLRRIEVAAAHREPPFR